MKKSDKFENIDDIKEDCILLRQKIKNSIEQIVEGLIEAPLEKIKREKNDNYKKSKEKDSLRKQ